MAGGISPTPILTPIILHASPLFCTCHVVSVCKPCIRYMCRRVGWPKRRSFPLSSVPAVRASSPRSNSGQRLFSREQVLPVSSLSSCRMNFDMKNHEIPVLTPVLMAATGEGYLQLCICVLSVSRHVRAATQRTLSNGLTSKSMTHLVILKYHAYKGRPSNHRVSKHDASDTMTRSIPIAQYPWAQNHWGDCCEQLSMFRAHWSKTGVVGGVVEEGYKSRCASSSFKFCQA